MQCRSRRRSKNVQVQVRLNIMTLNVASCFHLVGGSGKSKSNSSVETFLRQLKLTGAHYNRLKNLTSTVTWIYFSFFLCQFFFLWVFFSLLFILPATRAIYSEPVEMTFNLHCVTRNVVRNFISSAIAVIQDISHTEQSRQMKRTCDISRQIDESKGRRSMNNSPVNHTWSKIARVVLANNSIREWDEWTREVKEEKRLKVINEIDE